MTKFTERFTIFELVLMAFMATLGVAVKPFIMPMVYFISTPLLIPGGSVAGGFYMLWILLGAVIVKKPFTATGIGIIQAIMVIATGTVGGHGALSIITYTVPGIMVDLFLYVSKNTKNYKLKLFFGCMIANVTGLLLTNFFLYQLPVQVLILSISIGAFSGGIGGIIAYNIYSKLIKVGIIDEV